MFTQLLNSVLRSSFMVLYIHRKWMTYQGQGKKGVGNERPGPPPCSVHTARELQADVDDELMLNVLKCHETY